MKRYHKILCAAAIGLGACSCATESLTVPEGRFPDDILTPEARTYSIESGAVRALVGTLDFDLIGLDAGNDLSYDIGAVYRAYAALDKSGVSYDDLFELKFSMQHWRIFLRTHYEKRLLESASPAEAEKILAQLGRLFITIDEQTLAATGRHLAGLPGGLSGNPALAEAFTGLIILQGDPEISDRLVVACGLQGCYDASRAADGPRKKVDIRPAYGGEWGFERWVKFPEFSSYERPDGRVRFRGISFEPGDILLTNLRAPSEFLFTVPTRDPNFAYHSGVYVEIEKDGKVYPAVYEIHEKGIRLVPLSIYLGLNYISYTEIYRYKTRPAGWAKQLSDAALRILAEPHGFNMWAETARSQDNRFLTCTTAVTYLLESTGMSVPAASGFIDARVRTNLMTLGISAETMLTPTDFLKFPGIAFVGCVDNGCYTDHITIECIRAVFNEYVMLLHLKPEGFYYSLARSLIGLEQKRIFILYPFLRSSFGFSPDNYPDGPPALMSFYLVADEESLASFALLHPATSRELESYPARTSFSIHAFTGHPKIRYLAEQAVRNIRVMFRSAEELE